MNKYSLLVSSLFAIATFATSQAQIVIPSGESVKFNDTFADNASGWSNVAVVNGSGTAQSGEAEISGSNWFPSISSDGTVVESLATTSDIDITQGPVSIYMSVRVDDTNAGGEANRFYVRLTDNNGSDLIALKIRPANTSQIEYRNSSGSFTSTNISNSSGIITNTTDFNTFKITLTANPNGVGSGNLASAEAYYYDSINGYVSMGSVSNVIRTQTALFNGLSIYTRNDSSTSNNADYYDQVVVTQAIPEPATSALVLGFFAFALIAKGRRKIAKATAFINRARYGAASTRVGSFSESG